MSPGIGEPFDERESWPEERWRQFQWNRIRSIFDFAVRELPFYRERFAAAGVSAAELGSWDDFSGLPIVRKADVVAAMRARGDYRVGIEARGRRGPMALGMTTGTLGTAILQYTEEWRRATGDAAARAYWWAGLRPGMSMLVAAPAWHCMAIRQTRVAERIGAQCVVPWGTFLPRHAGEFLDAIADLHPSFLCLFLPMLYALIEESRRRHLRVTDGFAGVQGVLVGGSPLTAPARQELARNVGLDELYDSAGSSEGLLAGECWSHEGTHYFVDICHIEVVDPTTHRALAHGQRGNVVLTTLAPYGSVHIRYDTEDVGEILRGPCSCGCTWPRLRIYDRRANAMKVSGREILWYDIRACIDEIPELVGVPCAAIRPAPLAARLMVAIQRPAADSPILELGARVRALVSRRFDIPLDVRWVGELPSRWKGSTVIDEREAERLIG